MKELKEYIRSIPDFPEKGIIFRDVTSVLQDADALKLSIDELAKRLEGVDFDVIAEQLQHVDGVMVGRQAYHDPYWLAKVDAQVFGVASEPPSRRAILDQLMVYAEAQMSQGVPLRNMARHWLNLYHGVAGARAWRRNLSDAKLLNTQDVRVLLMDVPNEVQSFI